MSDKKAVEKRKGSEISTNEKRPGRYIRPRTSINETPESVVILMDVPGVSKENLEIQFNRGELTVIGNREPWDRGKMNACYCERIEGSYRRVFSLDNTLDPGKIDAKLNQGVLELVIPKIEAAKPRKIAVKTA
jgi:HSP20 family protein